MTPRRPASPAADDFLPLPVAEFHVLVSLADGPRHGYGIMSDVRQRSEASPNAASGGEAASVVPRLGPGTLYGALRRMLERGLIEEAAAPRGEAGERRLFYRLTALGRDVAVSEARRMEACVALLRRTQLVGRLETA